MGNTAIDAIFGAMQKICDNGGLRDLEEHYPNFNECLCFMLPKKPSGHDDAHGNFYDADATRPISVANTDNRVMANAMRYAIEPALARWVSPNQRGFIGGRSLLANVIDIEEAMVMTALHEDDGACIFCDLAAAFPCMDHGFVRDLFTAMELPDHVMAFFEALYARNFCRLVVRGERMEGFPLTAGIRQGCPLSPLFFAVAADLLLRRLARLLPEATVRAYADDLAIVVKHGPSAAHVLEPLFSEYEKVSGLRLHIGKTVWIPLNGGSAEEARASMRIVNPNWGSLQFDMYATYLGFVMGPMKGEKSWDKALNKFTLRARAWGRVGCGFFMTCMAYGTYIKSTLQFVAQLEDFPANWDEREMNAITRLFPGPYAWIPLDVFRSLGTVGFRGNLTDMRAHAQASQYRVWRYEAMAHGGLNIEARARSIQHALVHAEYVHRAWAWHDWMSRLFIMKLHSTATEYRHRQLGPREMARRIVGNGQDEAGRELQVRRGWTRSARLAVTVENKLRVVNYTRAKLNKFPSRQLPRVRTDRAINLLEHMDAWAPPRIKAALIRTWWGGWCTGRRFQQGGGRCAFGCEGAEDDMRHYPYCRVIRDAFSPALAPVPPEDLADDFIALLPGTRQQTQSRLIRLTAAYLTHCRSRHRRLPTTAVKEVMRDTALELALGWTH